VNSTVDLTSAPIGTVEQALFALGRGEFVVVLDSAERENEGDLILAADRATPEALSFMIRHTSGLVCVGMTGERLDELEIPMMVAQNSDSMGTAFTVSVDFGPGTGTGISAADRSATVRALVDPAAVGGDFLRPGHVFPLRAKPGGVLERPGHTEAAVDLARLAGCSPAGVLCEIVNDDGTMARATQLAEFARRHGLVVITIEQLIAHRRRSEALVRRSGRAAVHTEHGPATVHAYESVLDGIEHVAVVYGDVRGPEPVLVRVHSECLTGDVLASSRCDCGPQLRLAHARIAAAGRGVLVYLRGHEGRGIGLGRKLRAYALQDIGFDTVEANVELGFPVDDRDYGIGAQILRDLGVTSVRLMTNNPDKCEALADHGLDVVERVAVCIPPTPHSWRYLDAKREKLGHLLPEPAGLALVG
jgi:3,4-dihydroxy 2-butanone 4-phosphate synthase/GTP cyclohydrolase II